MIVNGELITHDIAMEKMKVRSNVLVEKGTIASIVFVANQRDSYFCSIPGHRAAGMEGEFEMTDKIETTVAVRGILPIKMANLST